MLKGLIARRWLYFIHSSFESNFAPNYINVIENVTTFQFLALRKHIPRPL